nr:hypothetical protein [uncultured Undibacterium sp.]
MRNKLTNEQHQVIDFINELSKLEIINWPIDYEYNFKTDDDLRNTFGHWFGGSRWKEDGDTFVQFGQDGTGSMYLLWFYPNSDIEPPVVFMGSEGETFVVASNIVDFAKQLASGKLFYNGEWLEPEEGEEIEVDWALLRSEVENKFGALDQEPQKLTELAVSQHPDFRGWVDSKCD